MFNAIKLLKVFFVSALIFSVAIVFLIYFLINKSIPNYDNSYLINETFGSITIIRDNHAIPHIFAEDNRDIFFGLGFAHAQDRLWQMILSRRFAYGNLSEILGKKSNSIDDFMRRIDIKDLSQASLEFQSQRTQEALSSYAQGVNSWLKLINKKSLGRGSPEFFIYNFPIKKWDPVDSLSILRLNGLLGSSQINKEILFLKSVLKLKDNRVFDLFSQSELDNNDLSARVLEDYKGISYFQTGKFDERVSFNPIPRQREIESAEIISISSDKSVNANPLLAHNIHAKLTAPSKYVLARMDFSSGSVFGLSLPGVPAILSGKNADISWARSLVDGDQTDLYIEKLSSIDKTKYKLGDQYDTLRTRKDVIKTKDYPDTNITLSWTKNGTIIPASHFGLKINPDANKVISIKSNAMFKKDLTMTSSIDLMLAKNVFEAIETSKNHTTPIENLMLIDRQNIAMQLIGKIPKRNKYHESRGQYPTAGWKTKNQWDVSFLYEMNPKTINPPEGYIISTGNNFSNHNFPLNVTFAWADTQKISRLKSRIIERDIFTPQSLRNFQSDTVSYTARSLLGLIAEELWYEGSVAPIGSIKNSRQQILKTLSKWNGDMKTRTFEPILYEQWLRILFQRIIEDDLGIIYDEFEPFNPIFIERTFKNINDSNQWCDIIQTGKLETCQELAKDSLNDVIFYLTEKLGKNVSEWNSEKYSKIKNYHNPFGGNSFLRWIANITYNDTIGEFTLHGGKKLEAKSDRFSKSHGSIFKGIYDIIDENNNFYIISTGQSGHFLSKHYDDLTSIHINEEYIPMTLKEDLIKIGSKGITHIN